MDKPASITSIKHEALVTTPRPWVDLDVEEKGEFQVKMPKRSFTDDERAYMHKWWLAVTYKQVEELNALATDRHIAPRADVNGDLFICADILSDALDNGRLKDCMEILSSLTIVRKQDADWPKPIFPWNTPKP